MKFKKLSAGFTIISICGAASLIAAPNLLVSVQNTTQAYGTSSVPVATNQVLKTQKNLSSKSFLMKDSSGNDVIYQFTDNTPSDPNKAGEPSIQVLNTRGQIIASQTLSNAKITWGDNRTDTDHQHTKSEMDLVGYVTDPSKPFSPNSRYEKTNTSYVYDTNSPMNIYSPLANSQGLLMTHTIPTSSPNDAVVGAQNVELAGTHAINFVGSGNYIDMNGNNFNKGSLAPISYDLNLNGSEDLFFTLKCDNTGLQVPTSSQAPTVEQRYSYQNGNTTSMRSFKKLDVPSSSSVVIDAFKLDGYIYTLNFDLANQITKVTKFSLNTGSGTLSKMKVSDNIWRLPSNGKGTTFFSTGSGSNAKIIVSSYDGAVAILDEDLNIVAGGDGDLKNAPLRLQFSNPDFSNLSAYNSVSQIIPSYTDSKKTTTNGAFATSINAESPNLYFIPNNISIAHSAQQLVSLNDLKNFKSCGAFPAIWKEDNSYVKPDSLETKKSQIITSIYKDPNNPMILINTDYEYSPVSTQYPQALGYVLIYDKDNPSVAKIVSTSSSQSSLTDAETNLVQMNQVLNNIDYKTPDASSEQYAKDYHLPLDPKNLSKYIVNSFGLLTEIPDPKNKNEKAYKVNTWLSNTTSVAPIDIKIDNVKLLDPIDSSKGKDTIRPIEMEISYLTSPSGNWTPFSGGSIRIDNFDDFKPVVSPGGYMNATNIIIGSVVAVAVIIIALSIGYYFWRKKKIREKINYMENKRQTRFEKRSKVKVSKKDIRKEAKKGISITKKTTYKDIYEEGTSRQDFFGDKKKNKKGHNSNDKVADYIRDLEYDPFQARGTHTKALSKVQSNQISLETKEKSKSKFQHQDPHQNKPTHKKKK